MFSTMIYLKKRTILLKFTWGLLTAFLVYLLSSLFSYSPAFSQQPRNADFSSACLPVGLGTLRTEFVTEVTDGNTQYRLFDAYLQGDAVPFSVLVSLQENQCKLLYSNPTNDFYPYSRTVKLSVAKQIALGELRYSINKAGSIDKFRSTLQPNFGDPAWQFSEEELWAFNQIGITVPSLSKTSPKK
ncbi:hypothetical protein [Kamptonema sp. PCC 6506]|uniref:hypothetical protein n=2 Tax=Kamptonema TaxID=1501433 RepID=UPI001F3C3098|nr:hypothetical protein [Kamptonema sp. PCC 6506]